MDQSELQYTVEIVWTCSFRPWTARSHSQTLYTSIPDAASQCYLDVISSGRLLHKVNLLNPGSVRKARCSRPSLFSTKSKQCCAERVFIRLRNLHAYICTGDIPGYVPKSLRGNATAFLPNAYTSLLTVHFCIDNFRRDQNSVFIS